MQSTKDKQTDLSESASWSGARVEDGLIKGVRLIGEQSRNGRRYPTATRMAAHHLFEGLVVNINHPDKKTVGERSVTDRIGKIINVREEKGGTYGDFAYLASHPFAPVIREAAERMPELMGFSIYGRGKTSTVNGEEIVEEISKLKSVDLVSEPATNKSLFEAVEGEEGSNPDAAVAEAFCQAVVAVCQGDGDLKAKLKKIKDILMAQEKLTAKDEPSEPSEPANEEPAQESVNEELETLRLEKTCRDLLEANKVTPEKPLVEALMALEPGKREEFVAWHRRKAVVKAPRSSEPTRALSESVEAVKDWASILRSK